MPTIGRKKKSKKTQQFRKPNKRRLKAVITKGIIRVTEAVLEDKYDISNKEQLKKYFNKNGTLKKSALRSNRQREKYNEEVRKAKEEIKQIRKEQTEQKRQEKEQRKREREQKKKEKEEQKKKRKDEQKRKKQVKSYKENGNTATHDISTYEDFIDILDEVYDEVALLFYDSDQIMQMIESPEVSRDDIVNLLKDINKKKMESLTNEEKLLLKTGKYHLSNMENEQLVKDVSNALYLSSRSDLTPQAWYNMSISSPMEYMRAIGDILTEDEIRKYITG